MPKRFRIIAADDDRIFLTLVQQAFAIYFPMADITAVLAVYETSGADLLITDYHMPPGMSGLDLIVALRDRRATLPVVLMSGDDQIAPEAMAAGATSFIAKGGALGPVVKQLSSLLQ
jgi:DNA-binding NtrC family response regulator